MARMKASRYAYQASQMAIQNTAAGREAGSVLRGIGGKGHISRVISMSCICSDMMIGPLLAISTVLFKSPRLFNNNIY